MPSRQRIELLMTEFGSTAHAGFGDFPEPLRATASSIDLLAAAGEWLNFDIAPSGNSSPA